MKRWMFVLTAFLTIFVTLTMSLTPASAEGGRSIKLVEVSHWSGKGVVFKFEITGDFTPAELQGFARIGDQDFSLDCNFNDDGLLVCVGEYGIGGYVGKNVTIFLDGLIFYAQIPVKKTFTRQYCYDIQGLMTDDFEGFLAALQNETADPLTLINTYWYPAVVGNHCSTEPPQTGDLIDFEHPYEAQLDALLGEVSGGIIPDITAAIFIGSTEELGIPPELEACLSTIPSYYGLLRITSCSAPQ